MILPDVNVLVYAHHEQSKDHEKFRDWWERAVNAPGGFGITDQILAGFVRVVTHPKIFTPPMGLPEASAAVDAIRSRPNAVPVVPGIRHWDLFSDLCVAAGAKGNAVPDAFLAALAIESGSELFTADRGFARYSGLRWRHPLDLGR
ncbi:type II toxin-antitoxin system VapC family toxin [soil metagenome]